MVTRVQDKFGIELTYQAAANCKRSDDQKLFGDVQDDASNLKDMFDKLKEASQDFLGDILKGEDNKLKAVIFATPIMKELAANFVDLFVIDTFSTNKFRMKSITLCGKNNNNETVIFAQGLMSQETTEIFSWILEKAKTYWEQESNFVLTDADPALISAVEKNFKDANLKLCGWHSETNFKHHLYGSKKSKWHEYFMAHLNFLRIRRYY